MSASRDAAIAELRRQQRQARERLGVPVSISKGDALQKALQCASKREREAREVDGFIRSRPFRYPAMAERRRWARTREIITRSSPGPDEDGVYLEMIARQAASIEMILQAELKEGPGSAKNDILDRTLIGTFPAITPGAFAQRCGDFFFVQVSAGLITYVYQASKAVILSWKPDTPPTGASCSFRCEPEDVESVLANDSLPLQLLRLTLEAYLFTGVPRAVGYSPPPPNYQLPLDVLTNFNERFVLAHEYTHTLHDAHDYVYPGDSAHTEEYAADYMAFYLVAKSGREFDCMPPNMSTQGVYFVLTALDLIRQCLDLARHGEIREDRGFAGNPPIALRLGALRKCYLEHVTDKDDNDSIRAALHAANTLRLLWQRLLDDGVANSWRGRPLHRIWDGI